MLQMMKTATKALSSNSLPTASIIISLQMSILQNLDAADEHKHVPPVAHEAKMAIKHNLEIR